MIALAVLLAFLVALGGAFALAHPRSPLRLLDQPNERSLHHTPTPRAGGLAVLAGLGVALFVAALAGGLGPRWLGILVGALAVAIVSFVDDRGGVRARWRLLVQGGAAVVLVALLGAPDGLALPGTRLALPAWLLFAPTVLAAVWMTNLYNFMDGMDGLAGGMAVFGFATLAVLGRADPGYALVCAAIAAASGGFLVANFPPARIFMGDVGAATLGFVAGALLLAADRWGLFPWWAGAMAFAPFLIDATVTLVRRALNRERVWEAHRSHFYQRCVGLGLSHRQTALGLYGLMGAGSVAAVAAAAGSGTTGWVVVSTMALTYTAAMVLVTRAERRRMGE